MIEAAIIISGQTPAKKNSKNIFTNRRTGKPFIVSNDTHETWKNSALWELRKFSTKFKGRVHINYMFYVVDNAQRDLDNMIASVNDVLQVANADTEFKRGKVRPVKGTGIIQGDNWQLLRIGSADAVIDRENPRAEIYIYSIEVDDGE